MKLWRGYEDTEDIKKITEPYHAWRKKGGKYKDEAGSCKSATLEVVRKNNYVLTPGRYAGTEEQEEDAEAFAQKMKRLTGELAEQFHKSPELEKGNSKES